MLDEIKFEGKIYKLGDEVQITSNKEFFLKSSLHGISMLKFLGYKGRIEKIERYTNVYAFKLSSTGSYWIDINCIEKCCSFLDEIDIEGDLFLC